MKVFAIGISIVFGVHCISCRPLDVETSTLDLTSWRWEGVEDVRMEWAGNQAKVVVPWGTDRSRLTPVFRQVGPGTVVPSSGQMQDFLQPVVYTVIHPSGGKQVYQVTVQEGSLPEPVLSGYSSPVVSLNDTLRFWGKTLVGGISRIGWRPEEGQVVYSEVHRIQDTLYAARVPRVLVPGKYTLELEFQGKKVTNTPTLHLQYPAPVVRQWQGTTYFGGDTLVLDGDYYSGGGYDYRGFLLQSEKEWQWDWHTGPLVLPKNLDPGLYDIRIVNQTLAKSTSWQAVSWRVGDVRSPHIFPNPVGKQQKAWGDTLRWDVRSWAGSRTHLQLEHARGMVVVAGYRTSTNQVIYPLPSTGPLGEIKARFIFFKDQYPIEFLANTLFYFQ